MNKVFESAQKEREVKATLRKRIEAAICPHCGEGFKAGDRFCEIAHDAASRFIHYECLMRGVTGSVEHQERLRDGLGCNKRCADDPTLTERQAAKAALDFYERTHGIS